MGATKRRRRHQSTRRPRHHYRRHDRYPQPRWANNLDYGQRSAYTATFPRQRPCPSTANYTGTEPHLVSQSGTLTASISTPFSIAAYVILIFVLLVLLTGTNGTERWRREVLSLSRWISSPDPNLSMKMLVEGAINSPPRHTPIPPRRSRDQLTRLRPRRGYSGMRRGKTRHSRHEATLGSFQLHRLPGPPTVDFGPCRYRMGVIIDTPINGA